MAAELSTSGDDFSVNGGKITDLAAGVDPTDAANVSQLGGGGVPDPSGEPDGDVLTVATGVAVWSPAAGGAPSGAAGGVLDGTYPNPGLAAAVAGDGLAETTNVLSVNVDGSSLEINTDALRVKAAGITEAMLGLVDNTTADVSITKHGLAPKAPNDAAKFLNGVGAYAVPAGTSPGVASDPIWDAAGDIVQGTGADTAARLALGASGTVPRSNGTNLAYAFPPAYEMAYVERTTNLTVTATTAAGAQEVVSAGAISFDGSTVVVIEFFSPGFNPGADGDLIANLWDASTDLGRLVHVGGAASGSTTAALAIAANGKRRLTPTNASHTYKVMAWRVTANGIVLAGAGGTDPAYLPAFIRITRV